MSKFFKYFSNKKVGIQYCKLFGVRNPELFIIGSVNSDDFDLKVTEDDIDVKINIIPLSSKCDFCVEAPFNKKTIEMYHQKYVELVENNKK